MEHYIEVNSKYVFREKKRPKYTQNLNEETLDVTELYIHGDTKNINRLSCFSRLTKVWLSYVNQKEFNLIIKLINPKMLYIYDVKVSDLSPLEGLTNIEILDIEWNTKVTKLWDISRNKELKALYIKDFSKLHDISQITGGYNINILTLAGGNSKPLKLDTLKELADLKHLEYLGLSNIKVLDQSLDPITELKQLKELSISNQFPTEEYAKLSAKLPHTKCEKFKAYTFLGSPIDGKNVMVVGKRKPLLSTREDKIRLQEYVERFKALQEKYKI
ncbi:leucine-rich repeat domain-containing protein [Priestia megaterium]|uniref:leucine-rich repeat domain-containing protein n=1 Tax=Priestia megaterium TaxID=1404 RepID=UPI002E1EA65B|nr:leucine-rich repeat domain-containing protein [Priestia megaterium]